MPKSSSTIDKQIRSKRTIKILDGEVSYIEVCPSRPVSKVPIFFAPGWGHAVHAGVKVIIKTLAEKRRRAIVIEHPHDIKDTSKHIPLQLRRAYGAAEVRKAAAVLAFLETMGIPKVDLLAHSEGTVYSLIAATAEPERFRDIILTNPIGMLSQDNFFKFAFRRTLGNLLPKESEKMKPGQLRAPKFSGKRFRAPGISVLKGEGRTGFILKTPFTALRDTLTVTKSHVHRLLRNLDKKGVRVAIVACVDDRLVPINQLQEALREEDGIDGFLAFRGGHIEILKYPKGYALTVESMFAALQKTRPR
jgi:pimeloyl-ACP methyl ester carboxylesterase